MRGFLTVISLLAVLLFGSESFAQDKILSLVQQGEEYMREGKYSRARRCFELASAEIDVDHFDRDRNLNERVMNDLTESQIMLDDCSFPYLIYQYDVKCEDPREEIRRLHLGCLFWQRPIIIRMVGEEEAARRHWECVLQEAQMVNEHEHSFSTGESRQMEIDVMNDWLEYYYHSADDLNGAKAVLTHYESLAKSLSKSEADWPWRYNFVQAEVLRAEGKTAKAVEIQKKVFDYCLNHEVDMIYMPCVAYAGLLRSQSKNQEAHDVVRRATDAIRKHSLESYRERIPSERHISWANATTVRMYRVLSALLPEGYYEDILYDAAMYAKNVLMDIDLEESTAVWKHYDMDLLQTFRLRQLFAGTQTATVTEWAFKDALEQRNPEWSGMDYSWRDVRASLDDDDLAVEIIRTGPSYQDYTAVLLRKGWNAPRSVFLCTQEQLDSIGLEADAYRGEKARKGYDLLISPLERYLHGGDNVFFSPEGSVNALNLGAFVDASGRCAADKYEFYRVSTTRQLSRNNRPARYDELILYGDMDYYCDMTQIKEYSEIQRKHTPLLWFDERKTYPQEGISFGENEDGTRAGLRPLEYTREEVDNIESLCEPGIAVGKFTGWMANEECFKKSASPFRLNDTVIYHIATHSFSIEVKSDEDNMFLSPEEMAFKRSGLLFSGAGHTVAGEKMPEGVNDGMLYAEEIAALDMLNTDMVVLSACNTAIGEYSLNGVLGLQRAFKKAGCKTIVMTLWKVNDRATSLFMTTFYGNLFSGASKHDAFTAAQKAVRKEYEDPYYWAPFIMLD